MFIQNCTLSTFSTRCDAACQSSSGFFCSNLFLKNMSTCLFERSRCARDFSEPLVSFRAFAVMRSIFIGMTRASSFFTKRLQETDRISEKYAFTVKHGLLGPQNL